MSRDSLLKLQEKMYNCLLELESPDGLHASGKEGKFGCIFGRDSFITIIKILKTHTAKYDQSLLAICKKTLLTLVELQGKEINVESGEQPGKFIHEYRPDNYERLVNRPVPWYVYPDKILRNYDTIDATPLGLIALHQYWKVTKDEEFLTKVLPSVKKALQWIVQFGDMDGDFLLEYELPIARKYGGLVVQSWADSKPTLANIDGEFPLYPIAPVEVQGIAYQALMLWADYFHTAGARAESEVLFLFAKKLKIAFHKKFLMKDNGFYFLSQALDGRKNQITTVTANPLLCLWTSFVINGKRDSVLDRKYMADIIQRSFMPDMFVDHAGIRTMSSLSPTFNPEETSYHNGSFWPILNGLILEGLQNYGFEREASRLTDAMLRPIQYFDSPIELYIEKQGSYIPYKSIYGQLSSTNQAWSAAAVYDLLVSLTATSDLVGAIATAS